MWTDTKGMSVIDFILESFPTSILDADTIICYSYDDYNEIKTALKNNNLERKYFVLIN